MDNPSETRSSLEATMRPKRALVYNQLKAEKGIPWSRQYIRRLEKAGRFPHHINLGPNTIAWLEDSLDTFLEQRAAESRPTK
jgi:predicted DNA-binding transcriptional regulator AlpA